MPSAPRLVARPAADVFRSRRPTKLNGGGKGADATGANSLGNVMQAGRFQAPQNVAAAVAVLWVLLPTGGGSGLAGIVAHHINENRGSPRFKSGRGTAQRRDFKVFCKTKLQSRRCPSDCATRAAVMRSPEKIYPPPGRSNLKLRDLKARSMSAYSPKRTNSRHLGNVRFVPGATIRGVLKSQT